MATSYYKGVVQFQSIKATDNYDKYSICVSLDDESKDKLLEAGYTAKIGEENAVFFKRGPAPQYDGDLFFGPVECIEMVDGSPIVTNKVPGKGSTVTIRVSHYTVKKGVHKGKLGTKLERICIDEYVQGGWDEDRPF